MKQLLFLILLSFVMSACSSKNSAFRYFDKGEIEANSVRYTKKSDIIKDNQIDITFVATHLNKIDLQLDEKIEQFLVYIHFVNLENQDFTKNGYKLLLNAKEPVSIELLEKDDKKFQDLMLKNFWGNYYLVKFDNKELIQDLHLSFSPKASVAKLNFQK